MSLCDTIITLETFEDLHDRRILINFALGFGGDCEGGFPAQGIRRLVLGSLSSGLQPFGNILEFGIAISRTRRVNERTINDVSLLI